MKKRKENVLVVGGTSGLGLELSLFFKKKRTIFVTGRKNPAKSSLNFVCLDIDGIEALQDDLFLLVKKLPRIDLLIYVAGFFQEGTLGKLDNRAIIKMVNVGLLAPTLLVSLLLRKQKTLPGLITITSTSQWTPREYEPVYTAVKAGLGMLANSVSLDKNVGKVLVAGPAGMTTKFWQGTKKDQRGMLGPGWVAEQIFCLWQGKFSYRFVRILREPPRVEMIEDRR